MTVTFPEGVEGEGNVKVAFVPVFADPSMPDTDEMDTAIEVTCYLSGDGFQPGGSQEERSDRRLCSRQVFTTPGSITYTINEITYVYDPQDPTNENDENEAYAELTVDRTGFIVVRFGIAYEEEFDEDQIIDIFPVTMGAQFKNPPVAAAGAGGGGTSKLTVRQTPYVRGPAELDFDIVAATP